MSEIPTVELAARLTILEAVVEALSGEVRTRRMVVVDDQGRERIIARAQGQTSEIVLDLPSTAPGAGTSVLLFAHTGEDEDGLGSGVGVQVWMAGDIVDELSAWPDAEAGEFDW